MSSTPPPNDPAPPRRRARRLRWIVAAAAAIIVLLYLFPISFVACTSDAYVRSDFVEVAPQVSGVVQHVEALNDQTVAAGDLLATLDPEPFTLAVDLDQKRLDGALSTAKVKGDNARVLESALETARAAVTLAEQDYDRIAALVKQGAVAQAVLDRQTDDRQKALDAVAAAEARLRVNAGEVASTLAEAAVAKAELALAQYNLSRTRIVAPVSGFVTNLSLRPGDYAKAGRTDHRDRGPVAVAGGRQFQGICGWRPEAGGARLDLARQPPLAHFSGARVWRRTRHRAPSGGRAPPALCGADDRLDSSLAPASGDAHLRPAARRAAVHGHGRARPSPSMSGEAPRLDFDLRLARALKDELAALSLSGLTAGVALRATLASVLSMIVAMALHLDKPYWAAITAVSIVVPNISASFVRSFDCGLGTVIGAAVGYFGARFGAPSAMLRTSSRAPCPKF